MCAVGGCASGDADCDSDVLWCVVVGGLRQQNKWAYHADIQYWHAGELFLLRHRWLYYTGGEGDCDGEWCGSYGGFAGECEAAEASGRGEF